MTPGTSALRVNTNIVILNFHYSSALVANTLSVTPARRATQSAVAATKTNTLRSDEYDRSF